MSTAATMCCRTACPHTTETPKAVGWSYMDSAPPDVPHWVGWWCPRCIAELRKMLPGQGITPSTERAN